MNDQVPIGRPTDAALWASMATTLRHAVLPAVDDPHTRQVVIQLVSLAAYARDRGPDPTAGRVEALADVLDALARDGNSIVAGRWSPDDARDSGAVMVACADVLVAALAADKPSQREVQNNLRPLLVDQLDADLAGEDGLLGAFRGRLADG